MRHRLRSSFHFSRATEVSYSRSLPPYFDTIDHGGLVLQLDGSAPIVLLVDLGHLPPMPELAQAAVLYCFSEVHIGIGARRKSFWPTRWGSGIISD